jgi:hypothetical protein
VSHRTELDALQRRVTDLENALAASRTVDGPMIALACKAYTPGKDGTRYAGALRRVLEAALFGDV